MSSTAQIGDQVVVMRHGQVRENAPVAQIFNAPQDAYTKALLACRPSLTENPARLMVIDDHIAGRGAGAQATVKDASAPVVLEVTGLQKSFWLKEGLFGTKLDAYCAVDKSNPDEVALAVWLGCGMIGGYDLPLESQGQVDEQGRQLWYVPEGGWAAGKGPGSWGGHAMYGRGTSPGMDDYNSWGEDTAATEGWRYECCSELYLPLVREWNLGNGRAPNGFSYEDLLSDVRARA